MGWRRPAEEDAEEDGSHAKSLPAYGSVKQILEGWLEARDMTRPSVVRRRAHSELQLESVARVSRFPIVETGLHIANSVYERIKRSNSLMGWSLDTAEHSLAVATASAMPAIVALHLPIATIDHLLCRGIDIVEQRVPAVHLPPHLMYWNTREFVNNKFVKPVLIRADSVKQIGSQAANAAVERLNGAIDVADQYVDRYLPPDPTDSPCTDCTDSGAADKSTAEDTGSKAARTIEHGARFSRKLQRRLTRRTFAEARALKEQGTECIHVLLYVVELLATDPKLAMQKARELWTSLSGPEPENQARPSNLEQLLVLFTRETARRVVHLVNAVAGLAARTPRRLGRAILRLSHRLVLVSEQALKMVSIRGKRDVASSQVNALRVAVYRLNSSANQFLEQLAAFLAGRPKAKKAAHRQANHNNHLTNASNPPVNGIE